MFSVTLIQLDFFRALLLLIPAAVLTYQFTHRPLVIKRWVGGLFAYIWQFQWRLILFAGGIQLELWTFDTDQMLLFGVPVDLMLAASLFLGALPIILCGKLSKRRLIPALVIMDIVLVLLFIPLSLLINNVAFIVLLSMIVVAPSILLGRWTEQSKYLYLRSILQNLNWACLLLWLFPSVVFTLTSDSWGVFLERGVVTNSLYLLPMIVPSTLLISALYVFAKDGAGTGFPYDSPQFLVTSGVYKYISNPMQLGIVLMMVFWGAILSSSLIMLSSIVALILFIVFKDVCNGSCQIGEKDINWKAYQKNTPKWFPLNQWNR